MFQTRTINQSKQYGRTFLRRLDQVGDLKFRTVQGAPFYVLKLPDIPSLLVETAYISNPVEERLLRSSDFKTEVAGAMALAAGECLSVSPATIQAIRVKTAEAAESMYAYRVRRGDTLHSIARKHGTTVSFLLKLNDMKPQDPLYAGRMLKMKGGEGNREKSDGEISQGERAGFLASRRELCTYRVKKGDTLAAIAEKYGTTVNALLTINRMRRSDTLYADQLLKLPRNPSL